MSEALRSYRICDFTGRLAGAGATKWLAAFGAEVIRIEDLDGVTIAVVDGARTGGGLELTLVCDFVIATRRSRWVCPKSTGALPQAGVAPRAWRAR